MAQPDGPIIPSREWLADILRLRLKEWERDRRISLSLPGGNPFRFASTQAEMNAAWDKSVQGRAAVREALAADAADHIWSDAAQPDTRLRATESGCPCLVLPVAERCGPRCSCARPHMSGGCRYCARYGELVQQRLVRARMIARAVDAQAQKDAP